MNERLIFVTGNSRSGTTMMGRILALQGSVHTFQELHFFEQLWSGNDRHTPADRKHAVKIISRLVNIERNGYFTKANDNDFADEADQIVQQVKADAPLHEYYEKFLLAETFRNHKQVPCEQTPQYVFYIPELLSFFPECRIIIMIRDPRDVLLSQKNKWKRRWLGASGIPLKEAIRSMINYHPVTISKLWNSAVRCGERMQSDPRILEIKYESLINDPGRTIRDVCDFTGIEFNEKMLLVPAKGSSTAGDSDTAGIRKENTAKWMKGGLSKAEIILCERITAVHRRRLSYADSGLETHWSVLLWKAWWPFSIGLGFLFNLHRMRNLRETLRKRLAG